MIRSDWPSIYYQGSETLAATILRIRRFELKPCKKSEFAIAFALIGRERRMGSFGSFGRRSQSIKKKPPYNPSIHPTIPFPSFHPNARPCPDIQGKNGQTSDKVFIFICLLKQSPSLLHSQPPHSSLSPSSFYPPSILSTPSSATQPHN